MNIPRWSAYIAVIFLFSVLIICGSHMTQQKVKNIKSEAGDIFFAVSKIFGQSIPLNSVGKPTENDTYIFTMEGKFTNPWDKTVPRADKISFMITKDGLISEFRGYQGEKEVWEVKLPLVHWKKLGGVHVTDIKSLENPE